MDSFCQVGVWESKKLSETFLVSRLFLTILNFTTWDPYVTGAIPKL